MLQVSSRATPTKGELLVTFSAAASDNFLQLLGRVDLLRMRG